MANTTSDDGTPTDDETLAEVIPMPRTEAERTMGRWSRAAGRALKATQPSSEE